MSKEGQEKIYSLITDRIMQRLKQGVIPWQQPWKGGGAPGNLKSKKAYRGVNVWMLASAGYGSRWWLSFKQVKQFGGKIDEGEEYNGWPVIFWKFLEKQDDQDKNGTTKKRHIPLLRYYRCWNLDQTNLSDPDEQPSVFSKFEAIEKANQVIACMPQPPSIQHGSGSACYRPTTDTVRLPETSQFYSGPGYYSTAFHELGHATGHESRLDRKEIKKLNEFGSHAYSREELTAEMTSAYLCGYCGIGQKTLDNNAAYIQGWLKQLRNNTKWLIQAAGHAQKAADFILG